MARKPKQDHLPLSDAVLLASNELLGDPGTDTLNLVGNALARVVPVYFEDGVLSPRALSEDELEGSQVMQRASVLRLKDGRSLSTVWIKRGDLRRGIAVLRTVGIPEIGNSRDKSATEHAELSAKVAEIEELVRPPLLPSQMNRVNALAISISRSTSNAELASLAMRLLRAIHDARAAGDGADTRAIELIVVRMRETLV